MKAKPPRLIPICIGCLIVMKPYTITLCVLQPASVKSPNRSRGSQNSMRLQFCLATCNGYDISTTLLVIYPPSLTLYVPDVEGEAAKLTMLVLVLLMSALFCLYHEFQRLLWHYISYLLPMRGLAFIQDCLALSHYPLIFSHTCLGPDHRPVRLSSLGPHNTRQPQQPTRTVSSGKAHLRALGWASSSSASAHNISSSFILSL